MVQHEVSEGFIRKVGRNYFMILTIDGQRQQRKTGTNDPENAQSMLDEWKAQAKMGFAQDTRLKYEAMRDSYLEHLKGENKMISGSILRDLNEFFKGIRIAAITVDKMKEFRRWRESKAEELERREETLAKEIGWRVKQVKKITEAQRQKIETEATVWVDNGVKATTNKRLSILRAMFNHMVDEGKISKSDVPSFPIVTGVDNKRRGFLEKEDLPKILTKLGANLQPIVTFIYETGMRSGAATELTWGMVDRKLTEIRIPGELLKNKEELVLPLVDKNGKTLPCFQGTMAYLKRVVREEDHEPLFDSTNLRGEWREICDELGFGMFDKKTRVYRGLSLHDFRRSACRNMTKARIPQAIAMAVSGHKTDSVFRRYAITDKSTIQDALAEA
jgi:integrase